MDKLYKSFNVSIRTIWNLPRTTHKYIACNLTQRHLQTAIMSNQMKFYKRLENCHKMAVRSLFNIAREDLRTTTGAYLRYLADILIDLGLMSYEGRVTETDLGRFIHIHEYVMIPPDEQYRFSVLHDLLSLRAQYL